jgi:hypothetical protein
MDRSRRLVLTGLALVLAVLVAADFLVEHHASFWIDGTPGFAAWFGLASAALAVALARGWARLLWRPKERADD